MTTQDILNEREKTHGDFEEVAFVHDGIMDCLNHTSNVLSCAKRLAINNIALKLARIVCGDSNFADHWDDIAGYAMLGRGENRSKHEKCTDCKYSLQFGDKGLPCDKHLEVWFGGATRPKEDYQVNEELCIICNDNIKEDAYRYIWELENKYLCRHCLMRLKEATESVKDSASSKMEHVEDVWYDAEKCLPLPNKEVIAHVKSKNAGYNLNNTSTLTNESRANPDAAINFWEEGSNKPKKDYQVKEDINCESCGVVLREDSWALVLPGDNKYYCRKCASIKSFY